MELAEILYQKTNDGLRQLAQLIGGCQGATRKDDLVRCLHRAVMTPGSLKQLWQQLDELSRKAVAVAYHNGGEFDASAFVAQYGALPKRPQSRFFWQQPPILLDLFIYEARLPGDLMPLLADLVPPPERFQLQGLAEAPKMTQMPDEQMVELVCVKTEQAGLHDLTAYLRLVAQGAVSVSSASGNIQLAGVKKILDSLLDGDFLPLPQKYRANQTIRPFGLDIFARESGLVAYNKRAGLHLTEAGQRFYQTQELAILLKTFETWTESGQFDELSRISALKGLGSKQTRLTEPATRREAVIEALSWCPVNVWIDIQDFYRALKIWHFDFEVETTHYSNLYVGYRDYGTLYGDVYWFVVKGLYVNVLLWEYLGSIGALDLLYTLPELSAFWSYTDGFYFDEPYFSLYDGLRYFRINNLGAYLLGQAREYRPSRPLHPPLFKISADMKLSLTAPERLTPNDGHLLEAIANPLNRGRYRLDSHQLLSSIEAGYDWQTLVDFLVDRHDGPLPAEVLAWLERLRQNSQAFKVSGNALLVKVSSTDLADLVMADPILQKFCNAIDGKTLVIPANREKVFRSRLKELEYVLA
jgi:hypothetical protein